VLYDALEKFLGLSESFPYIAIGDLEMLAALDVIFPAAEFGLEPAAYFSVRPGDAGSTVNGLGVRDAKDIALVVPTLGATVALVACEPGAVQDVLRSLDEAGIHAVLMLTPTLRPQHPEGMEVTYFRIPCALKALASVAPRPAHCCATPGRAPRQERPKH
jgi:NADH/NAD ratio-sensing transcriptional regulator Rex